MKFIRKYPLSSFFILTFLASTLLWLPVLLFHLPIVSEEYHLLSIYILPGISIGVTGTAFALTAVTSGKVGVKRLLLRFVQWRVGFKWYVFVLVALPVAAIVAGSLVTDGFNTALKAFAPASLIFYPLAYASHFYFGPLFEEAGWRGFGLPLMQERLGALKATLLLGMLWGIWHLPIYLPINIAEEGLTGGLAAFGEFVVSAIALAVIFTWVYNNTKGSLLIAVLLHGSVDGTQTYNQMLRVKGIITPSAAENIQICSVITILLFAALILILTRGKLGYDKRLSNQKPLS